MESKQINIFVYGMSGSGKDTICNYLRDTQNFLKLRIAKTIKQVILEEENLTFDELEYLKRTNPKYRDRHHEVSTMLGEDKSSLNRLQQLIDNTSIDFEMFNVEDLKSYNKAICDVRTFDETTKCLKGGFYGIFLTRVTSEYKNTKHYTETNMFANGQLAQLIQEYPDKILVIENNSNTSFNNFKELQNFILPKSEKELQAFFDITDGSSNELIESVLEFIIHINNNI